MRGYGNGRARLAGRLRSFLSGRRGTSGETLVESLVAIMIATVVFALLANSIAVAARVSSAIRNSDVAVDESAAERGAELEVTVSDGHTEATGTAVGYSIPAAEGGDLYEYYEYIPDE